MKYIKVIALFLVLILAIACFTGCKAPSGKVGAADAGNGEKESVSSVTESTADEPKVYTSFTAEAYNETSLSDGVEPLVSLNYDGVKKTRTYLSGNEGIAPTVIKTVFGKEEVFSVASFRMFNDYLGHNYGYFHSDNYSVQIDMATGDMLVITSSKYEEEKIGLSGKTRATEKELLEKADEYLEQLTDEDISSFTKVYTPGSLQSDIGMDIGYKVTYLRGDGTDETLWAYKIIMDYSGTFSRFYGNEYNNCEAIRDFTDEAMSEARKAAQAKYEAVCKDNGIDPKKAEIISTELVYLEEEQCPVINVRYKHNDKTVQNNGFIMISVKAK